MADYLTRARALVQSLFGGPGASPPAVAAPEPVGDNLVIASGTLRFADPARASDPASWLEAFSLAVARNVPIDRQALALVGDVVKKSASTNLLSPERNREWLLDFLRPRPGLSRSLTQMRDCRLLACLLPGVPSAA